MALDISQVIRLKGSVDGVLAAAVEGPTAAPGLADAYIRTREICLGLVKGTDVESEFVMMFPAIEPIGKERVPAEPNMSAADGESARALLGQLSGWLGSWSSAEAASSPD